MCEDAMTKPMTDERLEELKAMCNAKRRGSRGVRLAALPDLIAEVERLRGIVKESDDTAEANYEASRQEWVENQQPSVD